MIIFVLRMTVIILEMIINVDNNLKNYLFLIIIVFNVLMELFKLEIIL